MKLNRREALIAATAIAVNSMPTVVRANPLERIRVGLVGCGGRGRQLLGWLKDIADVDVDVVSLSDLIASNAHAAAKILADATRPQKPIRHENYQTILDDKSVDAVIIATTQHWHGLPFLHAIQAKKPIYIKSLWPTPWPKDKGWCRRPPNRACSP